MIGDALMSGIDEQCVVPICPICEKIPAFWILYKDGGGIGYDGWYWIHSDEYLKNKPSFDKLVSMKSYNGNSITLDDVTVVVCRPNDIKRDEQHKFTAESPTFQKVMKVARRLENERN